MVGSPGFSSDPLGPDGTAGTSDPDGTPGNGDEYNDDTASNGRVSAYSGAAGTVIHAIPGIASFDNLGRSVGTAGDVDGDGQSDIFSAAPNFDLDPDGTPASGDEKSNAGRAYAFSGKDASTLWTSDGENALDFFGHAVRGAGGDINFDGTDDSIVGAFGYDVDPDGTPASGDEKSSAGRVYAISGVDGSVLLTFDGDNTSDLLGRHVGGAGDVDADGFSDIIAGALGFDFDPDGTPASGDELSASGRAYVYSGQTGALLFTVDGLAGADQVGTSVSGAGDVNGDGNADVVVGAPHYDPAPDGTLQFSAGRAIVASNATMSLAADTHQLSLSIANSQTMTISAGIGNAGGNYWLFTGFAASGDTPGVTMAPGVVIPLNQPDPLTSFVIGLTQLGGGAPTFTGWKSTLDGAGNASPSLNTFGPTPAPLGVTLHHAALVYTSNGCGAGCDTFQLATNWVPMTTTP